MDRAENVPPLSLLSGQLKLGLQEEDKKETLWEDLFAFGGDLLFYLWRRLFGVLSWFGAFILSGFTLTEQFKFWLSRKFVRRRGQLAFPFAHATLIGVSVSLLVVTAGLGDLAFKDSEVESSTTNPSILVSDPELITEESELLALKAFTYEVVEGDDLYSIADRFRRTPDSIASENKLLLDPVTNTYVVNTGDVLSIPPLEGFSYTIRSGDTVEALARQFSTTAQIIVELNYLFEPFTLNAGTQILIPVENSYLSGGLSSPTGTCGPLSLRWPTASSTLIGSYSSYHRAVDLAADYETLYAVADGQVRAVADYNGVCRSFSSQCNYGYGGLVYIDIGEGYQARYGHISKPLVGVGQQVRRGDPVAISGESGVAFGPHLHFELLCNGTKANPLPYFSR
ncbi:peptidoglycan DD-metalloendopeptidase family protein [Candidatus Saccharibacteria bacterium]|nr:peptidoglycan DD-metalloendopeptidase family protein [Candidatus Saccharibacteria bacterium]